LSGVTGNPFRTFYESASAIELIEAPDPNFKLRFLVGTHTGELEIFDSQAHQICAGKDHTGADISHIVYDPDSKVNKHACAQGCEGIASKRLGSPYSGRAGCWIKVKNPAAPAVRHEAEEEWNSLNALARSVSRGRHEIWQQQP
jgi:hypothetical protein